MNPIFLLARRAEDERWAGSNERMISEVSILLNGGIKLNTVMKTLELVQSDKSTPSILLEIIGRICAFLLAQTGRYAEASVAHEQIASALSKRDDPQSLLLSVIHFQHASDALGPDGQSNPRMKLSEAVVLCRLAELSTGPHSNLRSAIDLCREARCHFDPTGRDHAETILVEGAAHVFLSRAGIDARKNVSRGIKYCHRARKSFEQIDPRAHDALVGANQEANARSMAAEWGIRPINNYRIAIRLYRRSRAWHMQDSEVGAKAHAGAEAANEGTARVFLAELGCNPVVNLKKALRLFGWARKRIRPAMKSVQFAYEFGRAYNSEGVARQHLASWLIEPMQNLLLGPVRK